MATATCFEELKVWQEARDIVRSVHMATQQRPFSRDFALRNQITSAATSTMSNIAEGFERGTKKEFIQFLNIAKGSNGEVRSQLYVALDLNYISEQAFNELRESACCLSRRLASFIRYLETCSAKTRVRKTSDLLAEQPSTFNFQPATASLSPCPPKPKSLPSAHTTPPSAPRSAKSSSARTTSSMAH
ncbi:MAG: four helix bundle protein [Verrucomicrobia bacterium]|nr:four helix bundle protein [Verrucomicrobiota bacterium]